MSAIRSRHRRPTNRPCTHVAYLLTCDEYEELRDLTGDRCQICDVAAEATIRGALSIDHDGMLGQWAVRGLLCQPCNVKVEWPDRRGAVGDAYLANPWYTVLLNRAGVIGVATPEPPIGTYARAGDVLYRHDPAGWQSTRRPKVPPRPITWRDLCYRKGPHRIVVLTGLA